MAVLVTGGAGYIGSHTVVELLNAGEKVVVVDNLSNAKKESLLRVERITGKSVKFYENDVRDASALDRIFNENEIDSVIHFAGLKAVGESVRIPLKYYENNLDSTFVLLEAMIAHGVKNIVFSSSATVYGLPERCPIDETFPLSTTNPYGTTKLFIEQILRDVASVHPEMNIAILRYFNPVGAHKSGLIGEDPVGIPNNLVPYITQVAVGKLDKLKIFGGDYPTKDGTGVRDYIHVVDLALGHLAAIEKLRTGCGLVVYNLGTGNGYSVLEMLQMFSSVVGRDLPYEIVERRPGDIAACYADASKAKAELGWVATRGLREMCEDSWRWQSNNIDGFAE